MASDGQTGGHMGSGFEWVQAVPLPRQEYGYRGAMGAITELGSGSLLMAYTLGRGIGGRRSTDGGRSWGEASTLVAEPSANGPDRYAHPSFLRLANGQLLLSYIYVGTLSSPHYGGNYYRRSDDDGETWGDQLVLTPAGGYNIMHNDKLVRLSGGRLIAPVEREHVPDPGGHRGYTSRVFFSDDDGYVWQSSRNEVNILPVEAQEPHVVELRDGRLLMLFRTYSGFVGRSHSLDRGESWAPGEPMPALALSANSSALNVQRLPGSGDLLLLRCTGVGQGGRNRTPFVSAVSRDEGETWVHERVIAGDPEDDYGYPSLCFVDDLALIGFHTREGLRLARIGLDWFYS